MFKKIYFDKKKLETQKPDNIRNINLLKNIGKIPENYYESTKINYSPNNLPFYSQNFSVNKNPTVSKLNFEKTYLELVYFLNNQRKYKSRAITIA